MPTAVINIGFHNFVVTDKVIAIVNWDSAPMRRMTQEYRKNGKLIDITQGRRSKSIIFMSNDTIILSAISQVTLAKRLSKDKMDIGIDEDTEG